MPETPEPLLERLEGGDPTAADELFPLLYSNLKGIARALMSRQAVGGTLQTTALVHEAYMRLSGSPERPGAPPRNFLALASTAMRSVLIDHARARRALKRDAVRDRELPIDQIAACRIGEHDLLSIAEAIEEVQALDPRLARIAEMRLFGGLDHQDIGQVLGCSTRTSERSWRLARALLERALADDHTPEAE